MNPTASEDSDTRIPGSDDKSAPPAKGPKFFVSIEDEIHPWPENTITTEQIADLGGWDPAIGVIEVDLKEGTERTLEPGEIIELKPGKGFSKKIGWKRGDAFSERLDEELRLLKRHFQDMEYRPDGHWVRIGGFETLTAGWTPKALAVVFQVQTTHPGTPPYGFYVPAGIRFNGEVPDNYKEPAPTQPPFPGSWGFFSWAPEDGHWKPGAGAKTGTNLVDWVRGFTRRFKQGK